MRAASAGPVDIATKVLSTLRLAEADIAEPEYFARTRKQHTFKDALAQQVAEHEVQRLREKKVGESFARASVEIVHRSETAEQATLRAMKEKTLKNAAEMRAYMREQAELKEREKARRLAEEEALLDRLKKELDAELAHAAELKRKEREGIAASVAENERLKVLREEMKKKAVLEEMRLQKQRAAEIEAKEQAHKDKYKHIAEKQDVLAQQLLSATAVFRERDARLAKISEEYAEAKAAKDRADAERRKADLAMRMKDQVTVLKEMMAAKQEARERAKAEDREAAMRTRDLMLALKEEHKEELLKKVEKKATYRAALGEQVTEKLALTSPPAGSSDPGNKAFILKTKSSDLDTEMAFKRQVSLLQHGFSTKANNSEALGPLVGFGAPSAPSIEAMGTTAAAAMEGTVKELAATSPLAVIRPKVTFIPAPPVNKGSKR